MTTRRFRLTRLARFGNFELDPRAGELRRDGVPVRLQEQPLRILTMLLEHPGEAVLRVEICRRLWPNGTVVEVGHGINAAILRLRDALGESADNPHFIQTLPRRGYRFNGQVEWEGGPPLTVTAAAGMRGTTAVEHNLTGRTVSHYRVLDRLGSGGMGVVYSAEDLQLGRHVALKFLAREFAQDPAARDLFQREARAASALNHPNVCTIYSVEEWAGQPLISMELVEGQTLSAWLAKGPLPAEPGLALALAIQVAAALEAAHRKGVVHRDLKPGNLMVTDPSERPGVKVLDFGIAKLERPAAREAGTASGAIATASGDIVGTPHYMSPEQQQGAETDARSDIFSFGLVMYEMLTGRLSSGAEVRTAELGPKLQPILSRCLALDPQARWQTAAELKTELERLLAEWQAPAPPPAAEPRRKRSWWGPAATAVAVLAAGMLMVRLPLVSWWPRAPKPVHFTLTGPLEATATRLKLSPDGRSVAFLSGGRHYVRGFDRAEVRVLYAPDGPGTPFWSPDGRSVAIAENGQLLKVALAPGSLSINLAAVNTNIEGAWGPDGTILIGLVHDGIYRIPSGGGTPERVTVLDASRGETRHLVPQFLPGGRRFLYLAGSDKPGNSALCAGSLDSPQRTEVMPLQTNFAFVPVSNDGAIGYLLYLLDHVLVAQPFDSARLAPLAQPYALAPSVNANRALNAAVSIGDFSATPATLAYRSGNAVTVVQNWLAEVPAADRPSAHVSSLRLPGARF